MMPKDISAGEAPTPRDSRVGVSDVADGEILAVRDFPGDCFYSMLFEVVRKG